jgi:hypothetical protein
VLGATDSVYHGEPLDVRRIVAGRRFACVWDFSVREEEEEEEEEAGIHWVIVWGLFSIVVNTDRGGFMGVCCEWLIFG